MRFVYGDLELIPVQSRTGDVISCGVCNKLLASGIYKIMVILEGRTGTLRHLSQTLCCDGWAYMPQLFDTKGEVLSVCEAHIDQLRDGQSIRIGVYWEEPRRELGEFTLRPI